MTNAMGSFRYFTQRVVPFRFGRPHKRILSARGIVCVGAKKEEDVYEDVDNLRRRLEEMGVL